MDIETLFNTFKIAIENERDAHSFYLKASKSTSDPDIKNLFKELAETELDHEKKLERRYRELKEKLKKKK